MVVCVLNNISFFSVLLNPNSEERRSSAIKLLLESYGVFGAKMMDGIGWVLVRIQKKIFQNGEHMFSYNHINPGNDCLGTATFRFEDFSVVPFGNVDIIFDSKEDLSIDFPEAKWLKKRPLEEGDVDEDEDDVDEDNEDQDNET
jgi:hypothetical protein